MTKKTINHNTEANNVDKVLSNHLGSIGLTPDQYDMNFTIFNELTNSNVRPDCCIKIGIKYGVIFENKIDYKDLQGAKIQGLKYLELLKRNNALCTRSILIVTDGMSFDVGQYEIQGDTIIFIKTLYIDVFSQITMEWMMQHAGDTPIMIKKAITSGDKAELKKTFDKINNYLRDKGLGKDSRLHITSAMLFLKLIKENDDLFQIMDVKKVQKIDDSLQMLRTLVTESSIVSCFEKLGEAYDGDFNFNLKDYHEKGIIKGLFDIVDQLHLDNYDLDIKGEAFEYFINYGNTSSDMGEYFTPRHIVNFMIKLLDQAFAQRRERRFGKTYLDPTCGTGGFLIKIFQQIHQELKDHKIDTPANIAILKAQTVFGNELNLRSSEIAKMNMILTGDGHSNIFQGDFLEQKKDRVGHYDVTIGNPPFGGGLEVQFVDGFLDDVTEGGYSIIIIPEGILFNGGSEFVRLRKKLLSSGTLVSIISLPKGIFLPYSNVKTDILFWKKEHLTENSRLYDIEMFDVLCDGFSLDNYRRPLSTCDLDLYFTDKQKLIDNKQIYTVNINTIHDTHELARLETELVMLSNNITKNSTLRTSIQKQITQITDDQARLIKQARLQELQTIMQSDTKILKEVKDTIKTFDVNLMVNKYKPKKEKVGNISFVKLMDIVDISTGKKDVNQGNPEGKYPFFTCASEHTYSDSYSFDMEALLIAGNGDVGTMKYYKGKFEVYQRTYILSNFRGVLPKYLLYIMSTELKKFLYENKQGNTMPYIKLGMLQNFSVPLPSLEDQEKIIQNIEKKYTIINIYNEKIKSIAEDIASITTNVWGL